MGWEKGQSGCPTGRPPKDRTKIKTNRELRQEEMLSFVRKFKPHLTKAVQTSVRVMENEESSDQNKLKAAALIISTYNGLIKDLYDFRYDSDEGEALQENSGPSFSLRMINFDKEEEKTGTEG
jgi:hypothetical protein